MQAMKLCRQIHYLQQVFEKNQLQRYGFAYFWVLGLTITYENEFSNRFHFLLIGAYLCNKINYV